jgi:hypothetical protein
MLGYYAAISRNSLPTFRENLSVPSARVKKSLKSRISASGIYEYVDVCMYVCTHVMYMYVSVPMQYSVFKAEFNYALEKYERSYFDIMIRLSS